MAESKISRDSDLLTDLQTIHDLCVSDAIEGTVFSKSWVLSLLVKVINVLEVEEKKGEHKVNEIDVKEEVEPHQRTSSVHQDTDGITASSSSTKNGSRDVTDKNDETVSSGEDKPFDEGLENELCRLWDASMNTEVSLFLHEHNTVELMIGVITRCVYPRLTEICVGILGNMVCSLEICQEAFRSTSCLSVIIDLLGNSDPCILIEAVRLIVTCLSHDQERQVWLDIFHSSTSVLNDLVFILQSSTNEELLRQLSTLLDQLLDSDENLLKLWANPKLLLVICEASKQCRISAFDVSCMLMLSLQLFSTIEEGIAAIVQCEEELSIELVSFLETASLHEEWTDGSLRGLMAVLSICRYILEHSETSNLKTTVSAAGSVLSYLQRLADSTDQSNDEMSSPMESKWQTEETSSLELNVVESSIKELAVYILKL